MEGDIQTRNIEITWHVGCQLHAAVLSVITKWYIKSNHSAEQHRATLLLFKKYARPRLLITILLVTLNLMTSQGGPAIGTDATSMDGCGGSTMANNHDNISFWQLHKLGKTSTNRSHTVKCLFVV